MVSNKTMSLGGEHGSSGVNGKGLVKSALTTGFNVSSLASKELDESFFNGVVHHGIAGWPSVAVLEEGVDDLCGVQFAGGIVVDVTWAVSSVRINAKGGENGVEMSRFGCVGVGFGGGGGFECSGSGITGVGGVLLVCPAERVSASEVDMESKGR